MTTLPHICSFCNPLILFSFNIHHSTQFTYLCISTLSILLILSKNLRLPICTPLILDFSFSLHTIVSLPYSRRFTHNASLSALAHSSWKLLAFTRDLMSPETFLPFPYACNLYWIHPNDGKKKRGQRKKKGAGFQPSYPGPFGHLLRPAGIMQ